MLRVFGRRLPLALALAAPHGGEGTRAARRTGYLAVMGVAPEWQGKGLGTALMQPGLEAIDAASASPPTWSRRHLAAARCTERNGFEVTGEFDLPRAARRSG